LHYPLCWLNRGFNHKFVTTELTLLNHKSTAPLAVADESDSASDTWVSFFQYEQFITKDEHIVQ